MSLEITLQNAISGLQVSQQSLQVVSNNIANVNVEGYSRKIVSQTSRVIDGNGYGVDLAEITRNVDEGVLKQLRKEYGELERLTVREQFLSQVNSLFGRPEDNNSLTHLTSELAAQFDALALAPEIAATQLTTVNAAIDVAQSLEDLSFEAQRLRSEVNSQIDQLITRFNEHMDSIVSLNQDIIEFAASGVSTAELEDQRDLALNEMSKIMDVKYFPKSDGSITVFTADGKTLIAGTKNALSYNQPTAVSASVEYVPTTAVNYIAPSQTGYPAGGIPGIFIGDASASSDITTTISSGKLKALVDLRDSDLQSIQTQLDEFAEKLKDEINKTHNTGAGFPPPPSLTGDRYFASTTNIDSATGLVRIAVVDEDGALIEDHVLDMANYTTVDDLLNDGTNGINTLFTNLTGSLTTDDGFLELAASGNYRVAINELDSSVSAAGKIGRGFSDLFGLNNLISSTESYAEYRTDVFTSQSNDVITTAGTLQFTASGLDETVNYTATDSLTDIATAINANANITAANIVAEVVSDGAGYRLEIRDSDGDSFQIVETGGGSLLSDTGLRTNSLGISNRVGVRTDIIANTFYMSRGELQSNTYLSSTANAYAAATAAIGGAATRTLTFTGATFSTTVSYNDGTDYDSDATADTISDAAAAINQNTTLQAQGISATVIFDTSSGTYQVKILDSGSEAYDVVDDGALAMATSQGLTIGDGSVAEDLAAVFEATVSFNAAPGGGGGLAQADTTFSAYSSSILSYNSVQVSIVQTSLTFQENLTTELYSKHASISAVNMDEELANMIVFEQAYLAAARMITTTSKLFEELSQIV